VQLGGLVKAVGNTEDRVASLVDRVAVAKEGKSPVDLRVFAPRAKPVQLGGPVKAVGNTEDRGASPGDGIAVAKIEKIGFTRYYVRVVNDKGTSSTNATIEYGEQLPPDVPSNLQAKNPSPGIPWLNDITSSTPVFGLRWWTLAPGATSAIFQISNTPFPDDARTWRLAGLNRATGSVPAGSADGINEFGLDLTNYLVGGPRSKGDYFLRVVPLKANGDLAAQPTDAIKLHLVAPPSVPLPESSFEIRENPNAAQSGEFAEKPLWGTSAHLDSSAKFLFRWSTQSSITNAKISVRRIDDWSDDLVHQASIDKQGDFELDIGPKMVSPRVYQVTLVPTDESGTQVAQDARVFVSTPVPSDYHLPLPDPNLPPKAWFNFDVSVVHYEPPKGSELYRYVLSHEPAHGTPIDDVFYSLYQNLTGRASPHRGDKVYLPPKQDNGKSWDEYVADGANFVAGIGSWAQGAASSLNSQIDQVKAVAAKGISSATGGAIPASVIKVGIDVGLECMGVPSNPFEFPGMSEFGSDYLAGQILDASGAGDALRDQLSSEIKSGLSEMAKSGAITNDPNAPILVPDPDYQDKPAVMMLQVKCRQFGTVDPNTYGGTSPVSIRVETWYNEGAGLDHVVLFEATVALPKMKDSQTMNIPVALRYSKMYYENRGRWNKAFNLGNKACRFTIDNQIITGRPCLTAWQ
jgi:hypothetical protein